MQLSPLIRYVPYYSGHQLTQRLMVSQIPNECGCLVLRFKWGISISHSPKNIIEGR